MKYIQLGLEFNDRLGLKEIVFQYNNTGKESGADLLELIAICILKSLHENKDDIELQEILGKLGIKKP